MSCSVWRHNNNKRITLRHSNCCTVSRCGVRNSELWMTLPLFISKVHFVCLCGTLSVTIEPQCVMETALVVVSWLGLQEMVCFWMWKRLIIPLPDDMTQSRGKAICADAKVTWECLSAPGKKKTCSFIFVG